MNSKISQCVICCILAASLVMVLQPAAWGALANVDVTAGEPPLVRPGDSQQSIASIFITEKIAGALPEGSLISLTLPGDSSWNQVPAVQVLSGDIVLQAGEIKENSGQKTVEYPVVSASTAASDIEFASGSISVDAEAEPGSLTATIVSISDTGETTLNTAVTVDESAVSQVLPGAQNQPAGSICIVESAPGAIMAHPCSLEGHLYIILPAGVSFSTMPEITVEGNLKIDSAGARLTTNGQGEHNTLDIPVSASSTSSPAQITIGSILLTLDRTVPNGAITAAVRGSAVDLLSSATAGNDPALYTRNVDTFNIAQCVPEIKEETATTAPAEHKAVFTLEQREYTSDGAVHSMDAAPYARYNRVLLPGRYLAIVLGIADDSEHITWNGSSQTMILTAPSGDVVSNVLGSSVLTVNGQDVQMDMASEMADGHIYLPARWLAEALGGQAQWEAGPQQVWISIRY